jgi:CheY-like chemotaxis protein
MSRVLVIDDEPDVCDSVSLTLERAGHDVSTASDGKSGLELCRSSRMDVVISDIIMPGMQGVEVIKRLREEFPDIRIIAISGGGNAAIAGYQPDSIKTAAYIAAAERAGADACLTKPFSRAELLGSLGALAG